MTISTNCILHANDLREEYINKIKSAKAWCNMSADECNPGNNKLIDIMTQICQHNPEFVKSFEKEYLKQSKAKPPQKTLLYGHLDECISNIFVLNKLYFNVPRKPITIKNMKFYMGSAGIRLMHSDKDGKLYSGGDYIDLIYPLAYGKSGKLYIAHSFPGYTSGMSASSLKEFDILYKHYGLRNKCLNNTK